MKLLVANRGEIAVRIIRAAKELGIKTVAVYSEADKGGLWVKLADEAICIGPEEVTKSYLDIPRLIMAALITEADAIHPGYGFLSENPNFAKICKEHNIEFVGPCAELIEFMGNKLETKRLAHSLGIPVVSGSLEIIEDIQDAFAIVKDIGYPILLKAAWGGGGKGIRKINNESELEYLFNIAQAEAKASFGKEKGNLYIEKYIPFARHIEVQIVGDKRGNIVHLYERECSMQYRHQKWIEEAPSVYLDDVLREDICKSAVIFAKSKGYYNAGTVEFLIDEKKNFYLIEMNSRIQVEHPITEMITGVDIIKEQLRVAMGETLSIKQQDIKINGCAIEFRIYAFTVGERFQASTGIIDKFQLPYGFGIRVDTYLCPGCYIPSCYDAMIAKLIIWAKDRHELLSKAKTALDEFYFQDGFKVNVDFYKKILEDDSFKNATIHTTYLEEFIERCSSQTIDSGK